VSADAAARAGGVGTAGDARPLRSLAHRLPGQDVLPDEGRLPSFDRASGWLHSRPLTPAGLRGRVVLVDFWTYTCVNWLRTAPYVRAWHERYADAGLTVVGVHTPEFPFERDPENVVAATERLDVEYPVALDSDYGVWDAFANAYWPAVYLADAEGRIRFHHFGEGEYARTEMAIQQLLAEAGGAAGTDLVSVEPRGLEVAADWATLRTPETYLGYARSAGSVSEDSRLFDDVAVYEAPDRLGLNSWGLTGVWRVGRSAVVLEEGGGRISMAFHARDVNLIMRPEVRGAAIPFRVTIGGRPPGTARGTDVDEEGRGVLREPTTYQLIRQQGAVHDELVEVEFARSGAAAYCFTFG
jgi:thiol-disulfide isomerase/thioredoxin